MADQDPLAKVWALARMPSSHRRRPMQIIASPHDPPATQLQLPVFNVLPAVRRLYSLQDLELEDATGLQAPVKLAPVPNGQAAREASRRDLNIRFIIGQHPSGKGFNNDETLAEPKGQGSSSRDGRRNGT
jgi:hypothetical protein